MGGQTALNLCMEAYEVGIWEKYNVRVLGADFKAIETEIVRPTASGWLSWASALPLPTQLTPFSKGKKLLRRVGFPLVIRASYTLEEPEVASYILRKNLTRNCSAGWMRRHHTKC
jgi:carbamoyl-phosphate synthase large subunit